MDHKRKMNNEEGNLHISDQLRGKYYCNTYAILGNKKHTHYTNNSQLNALGVLLGLNGPLGTWWTKYES